MVWVLPVPSAEAEPRVGPVPRRRNTEGAEDVKVAWLDTSWAEPSENCAVAW